jgi:antitoxin component YwqK of YwqJK toxin-antitoxin module
MNRFIKSIFLIIVLLEGCQSIAQKEYNKNQVFIDEKTNLTFDINTKNAFNGLLVSYYEGKNVVKEKYTYVNGKKEGPGFFYYENGELDSKFNYKNDLLNGHYQKYFQNGKLEFEHYYKNGMHEGISRLFYSNGKIKKEEEYSTDDQIVNSRDYYDSGILENETTSIKKTREGLHDYLSRDYYQNGKLMRVANFKNDTLNGLYQIYYDTGKLCVSVIYKDDGEPESGQNENGQIKPPELKKSIAVCDEMWYNST